ncbi:MAG: hypothetical protein EOO11_09155 [Chitinophagaceae bacterium]|nr:MAG: hypothetical protein EOO11_09155 [Chitinophagaceae bacterium]
MTQLSPKKYIQTKARSLPVNKCLVNFDWQETGMVSLTVMRRHVNGRLTGAFYVVDLLCTGVKRTFEFFNADEQEVTERLPYFGTETTEIEYNLAHNIVYAGVEFAAEFGIAPHPDFSLTKYILEPDTDAVPVIEIEVGDREDGLPHLIEFRPGEFADALSKLKKNAGEGNFYYSVLPVPGDDDEEVEAISEAPAPVRLGDIPVGQLSAYDAEFIATEDLLQKEIVEARTVEEQVTIQVELLIRNLGRQFPELYDASAAETRPEFALIGAAESLPEGVTPGQQQEAEGALVTLYSAAADPEMKDKRKRQPMFLKHLNQYAANPLLVVEMLERSHSEELKKVSERSRELLEGMLESLPLSRLTLLLQQLLAGEEHEPRFAPLYGQELTAPGAEATRHLPELFDAFMVRMLRALREKDLKGAVYFYELAVAMQRDTFFFRAAQVALLSALLEHAMANQPAAEGAQ